jgi:AGCS family alanine or glycine:cation symporter
MATFIIGIAMAFVIGLVIIGGIKRIAKITEKIVPMMAITYIVASLIIIFFHWNLLPLAFKAIWSGAFNLNAGIGGLIGVMIVGFQRAAFSNEAGAGSAAIAHAAVKTKFPASEGIVALLEPFIDTVVICTMTALVIILFNIDGKFDYGTAQNGLIYIKSSQQWVGGVDLTSMAYSDVMPWFSYVLTIAIVLFAFSTMISWSYYGLQAWKFLFGKGKITDLVYKILFVLFVIVGASTSMNSVIKFSDAMMLGLVFPNMIGLILLFPKVKTELDNYLAAIKSFKNKKN